VNAAPDPYAVIDALAPLIEIDVSPEDRAAIAAHLATAARLQALVDAFAIPDHEEPAAIFEPAAPAGEEGSS
jgi:hypothetical protein